MEPQRLQRRYTSIAKLHALLNELFAKGTFSLEVSTSTLLCTEASPRWPFFQHLETGVLTTVKIENDSILLRAPRELSQSPAGWKMIALKADKVRDRFSNKRVGIWGSTFIPDSSFDEILTSNVISELVVESGCGEKTMFSYEDICKRINARDSKRIFAILLYLNAGHLIVNFLSGWFSAPRLPLREAELAEIIVSDTCREKRKSFYMDQWMFIAPILTEGQHEIYHEEVRMPFLEDEEFSTQGQNSTTSLVTVPLCHLRIDERRDTLKLSTNASYGLFSSYGSIPRVKIVRKKLRNDNMAGNELKLHRRLKHPSIVPFYASYTLRDTVNILLQKCDQTLATFLREEDHPPPWSEQKTYFSALHGLSDAIGSIHNFRDHTSPKPFNSVGCHHDIKPDNVLVDVRAGNLLLADFGLAEINTPVYGSNRTAPGGTADYVSPEAIKLSFGAEDQHVGRKSDVWSFGCIMTDIIVYLENPCGNAISRFREDRKMTLDFNDWPLRIAFFHGLNEPNQGVWRRLDEIERGSKSKARRDMVALIRDMLYLDQEKRPEIKSVTKRLDWIIESFADVDTGGGFMNYQDVTALTHSGLSADHLQSPESTTGTVCDQHGASSSHKTGLDREAAENSHSMSNHARVSQPETALSRYHRDSPRLLFVLDNPKQERRVKTLWKWREGPGPNLHTWASSEGSKVLLIHPPEFEGFEHPISCVAAHIVESVPKYSTGWREMKVISFFCEPNTLDSKTNVFELSRSLLRQLLAYIAIQAQREPDLRELSAFDDVAQVMAAFMNNFKLLKPDTTLVCVINRLHLCKDRPRAENWPTEAVIKCLVELASRKISTSEARFKLLITMPSANYADLARKRYKIDSNDVMFFTGGSDDDRDGLSDTFFRANLLDWR
ncbi:MAG: hypothetical protein Q9195_002489 [Heterodermia aff. obscurata]